MESARYLVFAGPECGTVHGAYCIRAVASRVSFARTFFEQLLNDFPDNEWTWAQIYDTKDQRVVLEREKIWGGLLEDEKWLPWQQASGKNSLSGTSTTETLPISPDPETGS